MADTIPVNEDNLQKIRKVAERLQGTCGSLDDALQDVFEDDTLSVSDFALPLLYELDNITMECQGCNWWCETHELDDNQICDDCQEADPE